MNCPKDAISMGLLNGFKVNGAYKFEKLAADDSVSGNYVNEQTVGYYKKLLKYYDQIDSELAEYGIPSPRASFPPDSYAILSKRQKRKLKREQKKARKEEIKAAENGK